MTRGRKKTAARRITSANDSRSGVPRIVKRTTLRNDSKDKTDSTIDEQVAALKKIPADKIAKNELEIIHDYNLPSCFSIRRYLPNLSWGEYLGGWGLDALSLQTGQVRLRVYLLQALQRLSFFNAVPHLEDRENSKWWSCSSRKDSAALTLFCMMFSAVL